MTQACIGEYLHVISMHGQKRRPHIMMKRSIDHRFRVHGQSGNANSPDLRNVADKVPFLLFETVSSGHKRLETRDPGYHVRNVQDQDKQWVSISRPNPSCLGKRSEQLPLTPQNEPQKGAKDIFKNKVVLIGPARPHQQSSVSSRVPIKFQERTTIRMNRPPRASLARRRTS